MTGKAVYGQGVTMTGKAVHGEGVPTSGEGSTITGKAVHGQGVTITGKAVHGEGVQDPKAGVSLDTVSSDASDPTTTGEAGHGHAGAPVRPHVHTHAGAYTRAYADTRACTHADARTDQDINIYNSSSYLNNENNEEEEYLDLDHSSSSLLNGSLGDQVHPGSRARVQAGAPAGSGSLDSVSSDRSADSHRAGSGSLDSVSSDGPADSHRTGSSSLNSVSSDGTADSHRTGSRSLDSVSSDGTADSRRTDSGSLDSVSSDKLADSHRTGSDSLDSVSSDGANPALAELACRILTACGVRVSAQRLYPHYPFEKIRAEAVRFMEQYATGYQREKNAGILVHRIKQAIYVPLSETEKLSSTYLQWRTEAERRDDQAALVGRTHDVAGRRERVQVETIPGTRALVVHDPATPPAAPEWAGVLRELALSGSERLFRGTAAAPTADGSWLVYTPDARDVEYLQTRAVRQVRWKLAPAIGKPPHEVAVHFTADRTEYMARAIGEFHEITRACPSVY